MEKGKKNEKECKTVMARRELDDPEQFSAWSEYGASIYWHGSNYSESTGTMALRVVRDDGAKIVENVRISKGTNDSGSRVSAPGGKHRVGISNYWSKTKGSATVCCPY